MIIYYNCTRDSALVLLTCHPYIHPLSFHEMISILVLYKISLPVPDLYIVSILYGYIEVYAHALFFFTCAASLY